MVAFTTDERITPLPESARLDSELSHGAFRELLSAFSRPGTIVALGPIAERVGVDASLVPILALADLEIVVAVIAAPGEADEVARLLERSTSTRITDDLTAADMVLALRTPTAAEISQLRRGDPASPELGARFVVRVDRLDETAIDDPDPLCLRLTGPGSGAGRRVAVSGLGHEPVAALEQVNADHPTGVDTWLVDATGACVGIPRSNHIDIIEGAD